MRTTAALAIPLLLVLAACGESTTSVGAGDRNPWGRDFLSVSVTEDGEDRPLVAGTRIRLSFNDDGSVGASAGCNSMGGQAEIRDGRLLVMAMSTTEMGCDPDRHAQDEWLADFLTSRPRFQLDDSLLILTGDGTEIRLEDRKVADPDRPLRDTRWEVDTVIDGEAASSVPEGAGAHLVFAARGDGFGGSTGCNQMGGKAEIDEGARTITFGEVITTKMACEDERMQLERDVLDVLDGTVGYEIEAGRLWLRHPDGHGLGLRAGD